VLAVCSFVLGVAALCPVDVAQIGRPVMLFMEAR